MNKNKLIKFIFKWIEPLLFELSCTQTDRQIDRHTHRPTDTQTDTQTDMSTL